MKVVHLGAGHIWGGIEALLWTLAQHGREVPGLSQQFVFASEGPLVQRLRGAGWQPQIIGPISLRKPLQVRRARRHLRQLLRAEPPTAVLCHGTWSYALLAPAVRSSAVPLGLWLHDPALRTSWPDVLSRRVRPDLLIANSHHTARLDQWLYPGLQARVVHCAVSDAQAGRGPEVGAERASVRAELETAEDATVVFMGSRLEPWKGHELLLQALARLRDRSDWVAWIAGGPHDERQARYLQRLRDACHRHGIAARVRFLGARDDVPRLLRAADIHCQPNVGPEPFGIAFVEAMYAGLPVVTTRIGAAPEIVSSETGMLVEPNAASVAAALRLLLDDPQRRANLGRAAPVRAKQISNPVERLTEMRSVVAGAVEGVG